MTRILVTGASGLLGGNLARDYAAEHDVSGVYHSNRIILEGVKMIRADLTNGQLVERVISKVQPELIVHCAAATDVDRCQRDPDWARRLNRDMPAAIARRAVASGARLIHISTDAVFDGERGGYDESDEPRPINVYAESKLAGEQAVLQAAPDALVVRTNLFGLAPGAKGRGLLAWFLGRLAQGRPTPGFVDVFFSPILVNSLGEWLLNLDEAGASGVLHVGGGTCLSKYEFGRMAARSFGFEPDLVERASLEQAELAAPRGRRLCLDSARVEQLLGREAPALEPELERLFAAVNHGYGWSSLATAEEVGQ